MQVMDAITEILKREGISTLFCFPTTPIIEAAVAGGIRPVICRQERVGVHMADGCARVLISRSRDRARVQYHDFRSRRCVGPRQAELLELACDGSTIGLRSPASKVLYVETRQGSSRLILRTEGFTVQASIVTRPQRTFTRNHKAVSGVLRQK